MKNKESSNAIVWSIESDAGKSHLTSLHRKGLIILGAIVSLLFLIGMTHYLNQPVLIIYDQQTGENFATLPVETGDVLEYNWIHSFEHIPWNERYIVQADHGLMLFEIKVAGFGAGIPANIGTTSVENGMVVMRDLDERFKYISWIHSNTALSSIVLNGQKVASGTELPHHQPLKLEIKRRLNTWLVNR